MSKYTLRELDEKVYSVEDYLKQRDLFPDHQIVLENENDTIPLTLEELQTTYRSQSGFFYVYDDEDGVFDGKIVHRYILYFIVKGNW